MLNVEVTRAESAKFHRPLLLLHGLWTGRWLWRRSTSYLAHRGWESWVASPAEPRTGMDVARWDADADALVRRLPQVPVVIAHGSAVAFGARLAARIAAPALVAIAPVVSPFDAAGLAAIFRWPQFWLTRVRGARVGPPRGRRRALFVGSRVPDAETELVPDAAALFRALADGKVRLPADAALRGLVVSAAADVISPVDAAAELAARLGWEHHVFPDRGHLALVEPGWEAIADDVHRWLVRALGVSLLAFLDDLEDDDR